MSPCYVRVGMHANRVPFYAELANVIWIASHPLTVKMQMLRSDLQRDLTVLDIAWSQREFQCRYDLYGHGALRDLPCDQLSEPHCVLPIDRLPFQLYPL